MGCGNAAAKEPNANANANATAKATEGGAGEDEEFMKEMQGGKFQGESKKNRDVLLPNDQLGRGHLRS